ncbi:MAG TPA: sugar phosphate isomerase/epimerase [Spirochaetia bacterium]|nr:sugar phosphate isomerase/epimerase [Spirochaetia bacterium]
MKANQVAAQLYTVRDFLKTPAEIKRSLRRIRTIGYQTVQISGVGEIADAELSRILKGEGLSVCSLHEKGDTILTEPNLVAERLERFGCTSIAYPFPSGVALGTLAQVRTFARALNRAGAAYHSLGKVLSYHNHDIEFVRLGAQTILELLFSETDPKNLTAELDTYWVQAGGANPADWVRKLKRRLPILHMKDYGVTAERRPVFREIGAGNLDWHEITREAGRSGCEWYVVEQDANWINNDPFRSLTASFEFIQETLVTA